VKVIIPIFFCVLLSCKARPIETELRDDAIEHQDWLMKLSKDLAPGEFGLDQRESYSLRRKTDLEVFQHFWNKENKESIKLRYYFGLDFAAYQLGVLDDSFRNRGYKATIDQPQALLYRYPQAFSFASQIALDLKEDYYFSSDQPVWNPINAKMPVHPKQIQERQHALTEDGFMRSFPNTLLNRNRKRAAYFIRNYFCDELTSTAIDLSSFHTDKNVGDPHVTGTCVSCHYKLDPLAGSLADLDARPGGRLYVVDGNQLEGDSLKQYLAGWRVKGYFPTPSTQNITEWPDTQAMFAGMAKSPEARRCFVQKTVEYFLGNKQAVDEKWLDELAQRYSTNIDKNYTQGFSDLVFQVVSSKAYRAMDRQLDRCYDFSAESSQEIPCHIQSLIKRNCLACHNDDTGKVNFAKIIPHADGVFYASSYGERKETIKQILEAVRDRNVEDRMPLGLEMPAAERTKIISWLIEQGGDK
jgi:hypothetical protein